MKSERYQILSLAYMGKIDHSHAEKLLSELGKKQRRVAGLVWVLVAIGLVAGIIFGFHLGDKVLFAIYTAIQYLDGLSLFHDLHALVSRVLRLF